MGGPGVQRSVRLVKNLPDFDFEPVILTITLDDIKHYRYSMDFSLIPEKSDLKIIRIPTHEPRRLKQLLIRWRLYYLLWVLGYPVVWENCALWPFYAFWKARRLIQNHNIELIYTSSGPFSTILLGSFLRLSLNVKWVADFRDPFTDAYAHKWPSKLHWYFCRFMEHMLCRIPDKIVVNTPAVEDLFIKRGLVDPSRITYITNGFD